MNRLSLASSVSKMSPELLAALLRLLADELSEGEPGYSKKYQDIPEPLNLDPRPARGCPNIAGFDRCARKCDDDAGCVGRCNRQYCTRF